MFIIKAVIRDLCHALGGIQLNYAVMLVNEAEIDVQAIDPDLVFACVTVAVQPSVAQLEERLTVVRYTVLSTIIWSLARFRPLGNLWRVFRFTFTQLYNSVLWSLHWRVQHLAKHKNEYLSALTMSNPIP